MIGLDALDAAFYEASLEAISIAAVDTGFSKLPAA